MFTTLRLIMAVIVLDLVDHSLLKKIKPYQNLCVILSGCFLLLFFVFNWFSNELIATISTWLLIGGIVFLILTLIFSISFIWDANIGTAVVEGDRITISSTKFKLVANLNDVCFKLGVVKGLIPTDGFISEEFLKVIPKWGNCIQFENSYCIDFLPNKQMAFINRQLNLTGYDKPPYLFMSSKELAKQFADMLWSASV